MLQTKQKIGLIGITMGFFIVSECICLIPSVSAMSSTNYNVISDSLNFGGNAASSENYGGTDTVGDVATGEGMASESYGGCAGFECYGQMGKYLNFDVRQGTTRPGTAGAGVDLGTADYTSVVSSGISGIRSIFITASANAEGGLVITVTSDNEGLQRITNPAKKILSASGPLAAGTEGYGICVFSAEESPSSPTTFDAASPYDGSCDKSTGHTVGIVDGSSRTILRSSGELFGGDAEILVKAAVSKLTEAGDDYRDVLTFVVTATY